MIDFSLKNKPVSDLAESIIAVLADNVSQKYILDEFNTEQVTAYSSLEDCYMTLMFGTADCVVITDINAKKMVDTYEDVNIQDGVYRKDKFVIIYSVVLG